jgi:uncharacterized flavoprotein (TIGR03862 family)
LKTIAIIGGGSAAIMLAATLDSKHYIVTIYERNQALGRKFLVAGDGGFNLTHSEELSSFIKKYTPSDFIAPFLRYFTNQDLRDWLKNIGIDTFIGSSKRVFPTKGIKPIEVLNALLEVLKERNVSILYKHKWIGWNAENKLVFESKGENEVISPDIVVFALGGASWSITGSDGTWLEYFEKKGIQIRPFHPSNCAFQINWKPEFLEKSEGKYLKNITITCNDKIKVGEAVVTKFGLEGGAIYALSPQIRNQLELEGKAKIQIDLKPSFSKEEILNVLASKASKSISVVLKDQLNLSETQLDMLQTYLSKEEYTSSTMLANAIKQFDIEITGSAPIDEAISTVGGISLDEVDSNLQLKKLPNHFVIGEMLDWDAPTGGYLLQSCFSMGKFLGDKLNEKVL